MMKVMMYTDGSARGNPDGPGGYGTILEYIDTKGQLPVKNVDLWKRLLKAAGPHQVTWNWVKGHDGHPQNERCDTLATTAADSGDLIEDVITE